MKIQELKSLSDKECQEINGGFWPALLIGGSILLTALPMIKSMWNSSSGSFSLPSGAAAQWGEQQKSSAAKSSTDGADLKKIVANLEDKIKHLIPPFYEF